MSDKNNDNYNLHDDFFNEDEFDDIESDNFDDLDLSNLRDMNLSNLNEDNDSYTRENDHEEDIDDQEEDEIIRKAVLDNKKENFIEDGIDDFDEDDITQQSLMDLYEDDDQEHEKYDDDSEFTDDEINNIVSTPSLDSLDDDEDEEEDDEDNLMQEEDTILPLEADLLDEKFDDDIEEDMYSIQDQILLNTQATSNYIPPTGVNLLDKPNDNIDELKTGPGTFGNALKFFGIACLGAASLFLAGIGGVLYADYNKTPETIAAENNENASQGPGKPISDISNQISGDNNEGNSPTTSDSESPVLTENDSKITYRVTSQGDVEAASVSYIEGKGEAKQRNNISLPSWENSVAVNNSSQPYIGISWTGGGNVNCEIIKDGQNIGTQGEVTSSAEQKTVACQ